MDPQTSVASWFADNLRRIRKEAGISQEELSIAASVHRTEVSQLERGLRIIRIDTLLKIAVAAGSYRATSSAPRGGSTPPTSRISWPATGMRPRET